MNRKIKRIGVLGAIALGLAISCSENFLIDPNNQDLTSEVVFASDEPALAAA